MSEVHGSLLSVKAEPMKRDFRMEMCFLLNTGVGEKRTQELHGNSHLSPGQSEVKKSVHTKSPWSDEENRQLELLVAINGAKPWHILAKNFANRSPGQLRSHWKHCLEVKESKRAFTEEEDAFIMGEYNRMGSKWSVIARKMYKRCDLDVKNRCKHILRQLLREEQAAENAAALAANSFDMRPNTVCA
eukprot:CAMPEP_0182442408 /NCGR_PEP_ID=MMETSP1172-20130603/1312_1 /TAXON_ID=708627 /ORGANISM="Timspurckia oligopyrenoides, Strain CCMP3278" /LENGTH=187 /DNA_ID=CAMNT_0024637225 /DNA_START=121 /DNA_END=684 /DNA_ORIENTATION=+